MDLFLFKNDITRFFLGMIRALYRKRRSWIEGF